MGHANLSNLSDLWVNLLYAKGKLFIRQAVEVAGNRGETLHASEGEYDADTGMVGQGIEEQVAFMLCTGREANSNWGWSGRWHGPFIEPCLALRSMRPKEYRPGADAIGMLLAIEETEKSLRTAARTHLDYPPVDASLFAIASDAIRDEGQDEWADFIRDLPQIREVYRMWSEDLDAYHDGDYWEVLDRVPFRFCKGKRMGYRDMPRLSNVTH